MSNSDARTEDGIWIVYSDIEHERGVKGLAAAVQRVVTRTGSVDPQILTENLEKFCERIGSVLSKGITTLGDYRCATVELTIQVTAASEVRLIGSIGGEVQGGIKLIFTRDGTE